MQDTGRVDVAQTRKTSILESRYAARRRRAGSNRGVAATTAGPRASSCAWAGWRGTLPLIGAAALHGLRRAGRVPDDLALAIARLARPLTLIDRHRCLDARASAVRNVNTAGGPSVSADREGQSIVALEMVLETALRGRAERDRPGRRRGRNAGCSRAARQVRQVRRGSGGDERLTCASAAGLALTASGTIDIAALVKFILSDETGFCGVPRSMTVTRS